jgi:arginine/ornithine transport system ATP-binding protein
MVFQGFNFGSHMTVLEDIIEAPISVLGIPRALAIEKANALLNKVGIYER